jgi:hypothetical protein
MATIVATQTELTPEISRVRTCANKVVACVRCRTLLPNFRPQKTRQFTSAEQIFGWVDVDGTESSGYLEAMCMVWVLSAIRTNNWNQAFKMLREVT